jgi:hypothetical protein
LPFKASIEKEYWNIYFVSYRILFIRPCEMINTIYEYTDESGKSFYAQWLNSISDPRARARIILQVDKMELG